MINHAHAAGKVEGFTRIHVHIYLEYRAQDKRSLRAEQTWLWILRLARRARRCLLLPYEIFQPLALSVSRPGRDSFHIALLGEIALVCSQAKLVYAT